MKKAHIDFATNSTYSGGEVMYDSAGNPLWSKGYRNADAPNKGEEWEASYKYEEGLLVQKKSYGSREGVTLYSITTKFKYDEKKQLVKKSSEDGPVLYGTIYAYDGEGNMTFAVIFSFQSWLPRISMLKFMPDEHGNWVRCELLFGKNPTILVRRLEYW